jgi:hypothetical protein
VVPASSVPPPSVPAPTPLPSPPPEEDDEQPLVTTRALHKAANPSPMNAPYFTASLVAEDRRDQLSVIVPHANIAPSVIAARHGPRVIVTWTAALCAGTFATIACAAAS